MALASNPLAHPTVMWRRQAFIDNDLFYNESFRYAQDYELWSRALMKIKAANLRNIFSHIVNIPVRSEMQKKISKGHLHGRLN
ncbi:MAG: hypothetical protein U0T68_13885 [Ferruginibacter sp.]